MADLLSVELKNGPLRKSKFDNIDEWLLNSLFIEKYNTNIIDKILPVKKEEAKPQQQ